MVTVPLDDIQRMRAKIPNKYLLTMAVAERARQIVQHAELTKQQLPENPVTMALREVEKGRVEIHVTDEQFQKTLEGRSDEPI